METLKYILISFASFAEHDGVKDAIFSIDHLMYAVCYSSLSLFKVQSMMVKNLLFLVNLWQ